jgi:hypothetical protein
VWQDIISRQLGYGDRLSTQMSWWQIIRNWNNPTRSWRRDSDRELVLDLDSHTLCGVTIGDPIDRLSFLGPATRWPYDLEFAHLGIAICPEADDRIAEISIFFADSHGAHFEPFAGTIRFRGEHITLCHQCTESTIVAQFGEAYWRDQDKDEVLLFFEWGEREWQIEFDRGGGLTSLTIGHPLLAEPEQRAAFGVNIPWPPV